MPADHRRSDRVAEAIREEVATFLAEDAKDPRITGLVTVTGVEITRDLRHAKVFVSVMGTDTDRASTFDGLASAASHLRSRVGRALRLRLAPADAVVLGVQAALEDHDRRHCAPEPRLVRVGTGVGEPFAWRSSHRSSLVQNLCNADVFQTLRVGQNSQALLLNILTGAVVGETKHHRLTPSCI